MKPLPASLSPIASLSAVTSSEKRPIALLGASDPVSSFEALIRATPGSRRAALAANAHTADKTQLPLTESAGELDLPGIESQSSAFGLSRLGEKNDAESGQGLVLPEAVASLALPFWPAHLAAAWGGALQPFASGVGTPDGLVQTGLAQAEPAQFEPAQIGLAQVSLAATAWGAFGSLPELSQVAGSRLATMAAGQTEIPAGFALMDPARESLPVLPARPDAALTLDVLDQASGRASDRVSVTGQTEIPAGFALMDPALESLPVLSAVPGLPQSFSAAGLATVRASADVLGKAFISDTPTLLQGKSVADGAPISRAVTSSFDPIQPQTLATPFAMSLSSATAPTSGMRALSGLREASGPRLSVEPRPFESAGLVLAQFGAVSVYAKPDEFEQHQAPSAVADVQPIADARGAWVPELGGMFSPIEKFIGPVNFAQHLAEHVDTWVHQNLQVAELRLQEPSSNPVLVRIEINGQQASVMFRTDVLACREALTTQMDHLSDLMSAQGLQLAGASVAGSGADSQPGREARPSPLWVEPAARRLAPETAGVAQSPPRRAPASAGRTLDVFV